MPLTVGNRAIVLGGAGGLAAGPGIVVLHPGGPLGSVAALLGAFVAGRLVGWIAGVVVVHLGAGIAGHPARNRWVAATVAMLAALLPVDLLDMTGQYAAATLLLAATIGTLHGADLVRTQNLSVRPATLSP